MPPDASTPATPPAAAATDPDTLVALLDRRATDDGTALVPLFVPAPTPADQVGAFRSVVTDEGATIRVGVVDEDWDAATRTRRTTLRYERSTGAGVERVDRVWLLHWHTPAGFSALAVQAGLVVLDGPVDGDAQEFTVRLGRAGPGR